MCMWEIMFLNLVVDLQTATYLALCSQFPTPCFKIDTSMNLSHACKGTKCPEAWSNTSLARHWLGSSISALCDITKYQFTSLKSELSKRCKGRTFMKRWETCDDEDALVYFPYLLCWMILCQGHEENPLTILLIQIKGKRSSWIMLWWNVKASRTFSECCLIFGPRTRIKSQQGWIYTECK